VKYFILFNSDKIVFFYSEKISLWRCQVSNAGLAGDATEYLSVGGKIRSKTGKPTSHQMEAMEVCHLKRGLRAM
jgi:hypothetical protein